MSSNATFLQRGRPYPLGATPDQHGVNFAVFSANADRMLLCLFDEGGTETRLVGIPPRRSRQVLDHLDLQPFYLIAGTFPTLAQAQAHAAALIEKTKGTPGHTYDPEIWSAREATDATHYLVADSQSSDHIEGQRFTSWQTRLGIDLTIRSSAGFVEKWPLLLPGAPAPANAPGPGK